MGKPIKILSFQPYSLFRNGGGSRVLRRLYQGHESQVHSLVVSDELIKVSPGKNINETIVFASPIRRPWMRWVLRGWATQVRERVMQFYTKKKLRKAASIVQYDTIHIINHGVFCSAFNDELIHKKKQVWVSFHDHYSTCSSFRDVKALWDLSDRRLMISDELGLEYQRLFGDKNYELMSDGVSTAEISAPMENVKNPYIIYFAGLLHLDYLPLFQVLADALDYLSQKGEVFKLILRGSQQVDFLENRRFITEYKSDFISDIDIKKEMDLATILYLPIKFSVPEFYLYSLSTKMISYLGTSGAILYHGPSDSAACKLLTKEKSAASCTTLQVKDMVSSITNILHDFKKISANAKKVATNKYNMENIVNEFWQGK